MDTNWLQNNFIKILLTSGLVSSFTGVYLGYIFNKIQQKSVWKKDFDRFEAEQLISLFEQIILKLEKKQAVDAEIIDRLSARIVLARYIDQKTKEHLNKLKDLCFKHRDAVEKMTKYTDGNQEEEHARKEVISNIEKIMDAIRILFSSDPFSDKK